MTKTQRRQQVKGNAFNDIKKIYHPKAKFHYDEYDRDSSYSEQREQAVRNIMEKYFSELNEINKNKEEAALNKQP